MSVQVNENDRPDAGEALADSAGHRDASRPYTAASTPAQESTQERRVPRVAHWYLTKVGASLEFLLCVKGPAQERNEKRTSGRRRPSLSGSVIERTAFKKLRCIWLPPACRAPIVSEKQTLSQLHP